MNNFQNLRSIYIKKESKFSWVVSCMAIVELQFGVICDSFCPFFAEHLPYHRAIGVGAAGAAQAAPLFAADNEYSLFTPIKLLQCRARTSE